MPLTFSIPTFLVITTSAIVVFILAMLFYRDMPTGARDVLFALIGSVMTKWGTMIDYHFGSSMGSLHKTNLLAHEDEPAEGKTASTITRTTKVTATTTAPPSHDEKDDKNDV